MIYSSMQNYLRGKNITPDADQCRALKLLSNIRPSSFFRKGDKSLGVYIHGLPGRGKSLLLEAFINNTKYPCIRIHFYDFLKKLHTFNTREHNINISILDWIRQYKIICFDEFHVHDVADSILLLNFLNIVVSNKINIIATSNYSPDELQPDPILHEAFLPAINIIKTHLKIIHFNNIQDYRIIKTEQTSISSNQHMFMTYSDRSDVLEYIDSILKSTDGSYIRANSYYEVGSRFFKATGYGLKTVSFNYEDIFLTPSSYKDYIEITDKAQVVFISDISRYAFQKRDGFQRFMWFIDIVYDRNVKLYILSELPLITMVEEMGKNIMNIERLLSRLHELSLGSTMPLN